MTPEQRDALAVLATCSAKRSRSARVAVLLGATVYGGAVAVVAVLEVLRMLR